MLTVGRLIVEYNKFPLYFIDPIQHTDILNANFALVTRTIDWEDVENPSYHEKEFVTREREKDSLLAVDACLHKFLRTCLVGLHTCT